MSSMILGEVINLKPATEKDKMNVYHWFSNKDIARVMLMGEEYPEHPIPTIEDFFADYEDFYFDGSALEKGRVYIIFLGDEPIGSISYASFHLKEKQAELDIWLKSIDLCGKGYGSEAINVLCRHLNETLELKQFIIRPSKENKNAIKAYEKAGFVRGSDLTDELIQDTFMDGYGDGDYGIGNDVLLIKTI
jgi:RimJ/RimL family protein N-acetyltransferase